MKRREFITGVVAGSAVLALPKQSFAGDCSILNGRIVNIARSMAGQPLGTKYNPTAFATSVLAKAGAKPMFIGPRGFPRYGREIDFSHLNPGDILQFNGKAAFVRNGFTYWSCDSLCTTIVLSRNNGIQPWSLLEIAYQYKANIVTRCFVDASDYVGNFAIMFRPQL